MADPAAPGASPTDHNFLHFIQFFGKVGKIICWCPPGGLVPPLMKTLDPPVINVHYQHMLLKHQKFECFKKFDQINLLIIT